MPHWLVRCITICFLTTFLVHKARASGHWGDLSTNQPASSKEMAAEILHVYDRNQTFPIFFNSKGRIEELRKRLIEGVEPKDAIPLVMQLAFHELNAGYSKRALGALDNVEKWMRQNDGYHPPYSTSLQILRAVAWMRIAEQENCLTNHTALSCLAPIAPGGVHQFQTGGRNAIKELMYMLHDDPADLRARWLLNIAYMTIGEWPDKVPAEFLVPPSAFKSDYDIKRFPEIGSKLGLDYMDLAGGVIADDFDNDGNMDLLISGWGIDSPLRLFQNLGDGTLQDRSEEAGLEGLTFTLNMIQADFNNDGYVDVLLLRGGWMGKAGAYPMSLLKNNGNGTFTDVTREAGVLHYAPTQTAVWFDFDGDGWLDLFVGNESTEDDQHPCELFRNNRNGTFTDVAAQCGLNLRGFVKGVTAGDYNHDGRPDLYLSLRDHENLLFRNDGPDPANPKQWTFTEVGREAGVTEPIHSFPTWFFDYDNDGWLDIFVAGYDIKNVGDVAADYLGMPTHGEKARLYHNLGNGKFEDVTAKAHLDHVLHAMGCNFGDLDNDGYLDFYLSTGDPDLSTLIPNRMFRNAEGKFFQDVTTSGGFGHLQKGHAVAFVDLDNDGDQDVVTVMGGAYSGDGYRRVLFDNPGHGNNWIQMKLVGVKSNRSAIGSRIKITISENGKKRDIYKTVNSGGSFGSNPLQQHIGLGKAEKIERAEIFWPATGKTDVIIGLSPNQTYRITEGETNGVAVPAHKIVWQDRSNLHEEHHHTPR
jgi:hypothetical protein